MTGHTSLLKIPAWNIKINLLPPLRLILFSVHIRSTIIINYKMKIRFVAAKFLTLFMYLFLCKLNLLKMSIHFNHKQRLYLSLIFLILFVLCVCVKRLK